MVVHDGHRGPKEIGVQPEFLDWLTDPDRNGAGALFDFGCYGANLMTWLMDDARPISVTAVTQRFKPEVYPKVDDEATIILEYPGAQAIIQASWNWPFDRKDMEVYGRTGQVLTVGQNGVAGPAGGEAGGGPPGAGAAAARGRLPALLRRGRPGRGQAFGPLVAGEQPDRHRDPGRGPPLGRDRAGCQVGLSLARTRTRARRPVASSSIEVEADLAPVQLQAGVERSCRPSTRSP